LYLKARHQFHKFTPEGYVKVSEYCEQAIALGPKYALAWFGLADLYYLLGFFGSVPPHAAFGQCGQITKRVLELDEMLPEAHAMLGILRVYDYDWQGAAREFQRALELNHRPENAWEFYDYSYLVPMRRFDEAIAKDRRFKLQVRLLTRPPTRVPACPLSCAEKVMCRLKRLRLGCGRILHPSRITG
jgi:tetratricopeptide (TPR) repeat protein